MFKWANLLTCWKRERDESEVRPRRWKKNSQEVNKQCHELQEKKRKEDTCQ